jgi:hypothetical protein
MSIVILSNVPAVTDVFLRQIRKNAEHFYGRKKMWRNKTPQKAQARLVFCVARAASAAYSYSPVICRFFCFYIQKIIFSFFNSR